MLKVENVETYGWEAAIRGMRNPMNSWDKSDSLFRDYVNDFGDIEAHDILGNDEYVFAGDCPSLDKGQKGFILGINDIELMEKLARAGSEHSKFRRMITVTMDITAPLYWWKEFDTYKVGTVANSCSTMHKIAAKEFELDDFSHEHLSNKEVEVTWDGQKYVDSAHDGLYDIVGLLNTYRDLFLKTNAKDYWWQMIQLLPSSYNQKRTVQLNYEVLAHIYQQRKNHKLDEWHTFCNSFANLPYAVDLIYMEG